MKQRVILYSYLTNYYKTVLLNNSYKYSKKLKALIPDTLDFNRPYLYISDGNYKPISLNNFISDYLEALDIPEKKTYITNTPSFQTIQKRYETNPTFKNRTIESKRKTLVKWVSKHNLLFKLISITPFSYLCHLSNRSVFNLKPDIVSDILNECIDSVSNQNEVFLYGNRINKAKLYLAETFLFCNKESLSIRNIRVYDSDSNKKEKKESCFIHDIYNDANYKELVFPESKSAQLLTDATGTCSSFIMFTFGDQDDMDLLKHLVHSEDNSVRYKILVIIQNMFLIKELYRIIDGTNYTISHTNTRNYKVNNNVFSTTFANNPNDCILLTIKINS